MTHVGDAATLLTGGIREDGDGAPSGREQASDESQESGLAGAVFAEDYGAGSSQKCCRDVAESRERAVNLGDGLELRCGDERFGADWGYGGHV